MSVMRDYDAGGLVGRNISREEQLSCGANFESDGKLYLVRCLACGPPPRGRENYMPAAASGTCAWCGWGTPNQDRDPASRPRPTFPLFDSGDPGNSAKAEAHFGGGSNQERKS